MDDVYGYSFQEWGYDEEKGCDLSPWSMNRYFTFVSTESVSLSGFAPIWRR
jgi:hypothetical protein